PLRVAKHNGKVGCRSPADLPDDVRAEARAARDVAAVRIGPMIRRRIEELIDEISMCGVNLDPVEAECPRMAGRLRVGLDHRVDVSLGHRTAGRTGRPPDAGRTYRDHSWGRRITRRQRGTHMPHLWK